MAEEFETVELEYSEDDILYYIVDENDNQIGFAINEDGQEVEYYFEGYDGADYAPADAAGAEAAAVAESAAAEAADEVVELEFSEDDIKYYLVDEDDNQIGFVMEEDGREVEYYFEESQPAAAPAKGAATKPEPAKSEPAKPEKRGRLAKLASIATHEGGKARKKAEVQIDKVRGVAEVQVDKATNAVQSGSEKLKAKAKSDGNDLGITREGVQAATADLNAIAKEGAETAKELKEAYDDIMDSFGFLVPKGIKRKLP